MCNTMQYYKSSIVLLVTSITSACEGWVWLQLNHYKGD